jgi:hypothetical protein
VHDHFSSLRKLLVENQWFFSSRVHFDDQADMVIPDLNYRVLPPGTLQIAENRLQDLWNKLGVLCFSAILDDERMWRLYADEGRESAFA